MIGFIVWLSRRRLSPETVLGIAIKRRELVVLYQPIISLKTGACVGAEARSAGSCRTAHWCLPISSSPWPKTGQILPITDFVIDEVMRELGPTLVQHRSLHVTINIAAEDIKSGRVIQRLTAALARRQRPRSGRSRGAGSRASFHGDLDAQHRPPTRASPELGEAGRAGRADQRRSDPCLRSALSPDRRCSPPRRGRCSTDRSRPVPWLGPR